MMSYFLKMNKNQFITDNLKGSTNKILFDVKNFTKIKFILKKEDKFL